MIFEIAYASSYVKKHYNEHELTKIKYRLWTLLGVLGGFFGVFTILSLILPNHESTINSTILFFGIGIVILIISAFLVKFLCEKKLEESWKWRMSGNLQLLPDKIISYRELDNQKRTKEETVILFYNDIKEILWDKVREQLIIYYNNIEVSQQIYCKKNGKRKIKEPVPKRNYAIIYLGYDNNRDLMEYLKQATKLNIEILK
ncbi:MAG: hypothetical protein DBY41_06885 [Clostridium sp.]|nr:MAG: hypothetical protein DBY41_06885 [Clostridium sp.]